MCVFVCVYVCVCLCVFMCVCACVCVCMYVYVCVCVCLCVCGITFFLIGARGIESLAPFPPSSPEVTGTGGVELGGQEVAPPPAPPTPVSSGETGVEGLATILGAGGGGAGPTVPDPSLSLDFFPYCDRFLYMAESRVMHFSSRPMCPSAAVLTALESLVCVFGSPPTLVSCIGDSLPGNWGTGVSVEGLRSTDWVRDSGTKVNMGSLKRFMGLRRPSCWGGAKTSESLCSVLPSLVLRKEEEEEEDAASECWFVEGSSAFFCVIVKEESVG